MVVVLYENRTIFCVTDAGTEQYPNQDGRRENKSGFPLRVDLR